MCTNYDTHTELCRYIVTVNDQASASRTSYLTPRKLLLKILHYGGLKFKRISEGERTISCLQVPV